jgi:hypothetical protein
VHHLSLVAGELDLADDNEDQDLSLFPAPAALTFSQPRPQQQQHSRTQQSLQFEARPGTALTLEEAGFETGVRSQRARGGSNILSF